MKSSVPGPLLNNWWLAKLSQAWSSPWVIRWKMKSEPKWIWIPHLSSEWVISNFNGTSIPKGSYSAKKGVNCAIPHLSIWSQTSWVPQEHWGMKYLLHNSVSVSDQMSNENMCYLPGLSSPNEVRNSSTPTWVNTVWNAIYNALYTCSRYNIHYSRTLSNHRCASHSCIPIYYTIWRSSSHPGWWISKNHKQAKKTRTRDHLSMPRCTNL